MEITDLLADDHAEQIAAARNFGAGRRYLGARIADRVTEDHLRRRDPNQPSWLE